MGYQELTSGQKEQIYKMVVEDKKTPDEVVEFFKKTYSIKLPRWKVSYTKTHFEKDMRGGVHMGGGVATRALKKKAKRDKEWLRKKNTAAPASDNDDVNVAELVTLRQEIDAGYKKLLAHFKDTLKNLRSELVKSRGEVREMMRGAGITVEEGEND